MPTNKPDQPAITPSSGKLIPPAHPVDVPNLPEKPANTGPAVSEDTTDTKVATDASPPAEVDHSRSSWADSTQPAPDKRNARTSIL